jgi:hypothetical protein
MSDDMNNMVSRIAQNIGASEDSLRARMDVVLSENRSAWMADGKDEAYCNTTALRIAGRQLKTEKTRLSKSGATVYEGLFVSVPMYKDWAQSAYKKNAGMLATADAATIESLVENGILTLYEDNNDGTYTKRYNPSLARGEEFSMEAAEAEVTALPEGTYDVGNGYHFTLVWDNKNPTWPSGQQNFKYGAARPQSEKERTCLFLGRKQGQGSVEVYSFRFSGALADEQFPTFVPGTIAMKPARSGNTAYGAANLSAFAADEAVASVFSGAPDSLVADLDEVKLLDSLDGIRDYVSSLSDKERWNALAAVMTEVVHVDPRDNGGYVVTVGDLDILSTAGTVDVYVPASQEHLVDFAVGSTLMVVGSPYISRDDEARLMTTGWWCAESLGGGAPTESEAEDASGWD